jgi:hypothetical protein
MDARLGKERRIWSRRAQWQRAIHRVPDTAGEGRV